MKYALLFLLIPGLLFAKTPARISDGKIEYAIATVGGKPCFTQKEKDNEIAKDDKAEIVNLTPSKDEIALSTNTTFTSYSDFIKAQSKSGIADQLVLLYVRIQVLKAINDTTELPMLQQKYDWLVSQALKMP